MTRIGWTANSYQKAKASAERVFGILGHNPSIDSSADGIVPDDIDGHVEFEAVEFRYSTSDEVLSSVDLSVPAGTTIGLAGTSGGGKSTLLKLLLRLYDVDDGTIRVDGIISGSSGKRSAPSSRTRICSRERFARTSSTATGTSIGNSSSVKPSPRTRSVIETAARTAGAHEFIQSLPDGYDTEVGERGVKLSGGQRQRVAIARMMLNDPSIVILDEATSDVDTETEELIQENLDRICANRTAFVIAHRLSTIRDADRIVVEDGEIIESGIHVELLAAEGSYADLWASQSDGGLQTGEQRTT